MIKSKADKMVCRSIKIPIDYVTSPVTDKKDFDALFDVIQSFMISKSNECLRVCNIYSSFNDEEEAKAWVKKTCMREKLRNALYFVATQGSRIYSKNMNSLSEDIYKRYFHKKNGWIKAVERGEGNPPMTFTKSLPIYISSDNYKVIPDESFHYYEIDLPLLNKSCGDEIEYQKISYENGKKVEKSCSIKLNGRRLRFSTAPRGNNRIKNVLNSIISGESKFGDSKIQRKKVKNKYEYSLILSYSAPATERPELDEEKVLGIDLGVVNPIYYATNFDEKLRGSLGGRHIIIENARQRQVNRKTQADIKYNSYNGHGGKAKLRGWDGAGHVINNRTETYNYILASEVAKTAIKLGCGTVKVEDLAGFAADHKYDPFLGSWPYFDLLTKIENKCAENGIKFVKVNPRFTSQTCSKCGHYERGQRIDRNTFQCKECGAKMNADYNAARNIAAKKGRDTK